VTHKSRRTIGVMCRTAVCTMALSACLATASHWEKPASTAESVDFDTNECEFYAQAVSMAESAQSNETYVTVNSQGQIVSTQMPGADSLRFMRQADAFDRCMKSRGYRSVAN
jgi:hypothetical protein